MYKNFLICDTLEGLSPEVYEGAIAVLSGDLSVIHFVEGGSWVEKKVGPSLELSWPLDSVFPVANEKEPKDLLGFGEWELIAKEPVFMWRRIK
jgi:hypothetical protein